MFANDWGMVVPMVAIPPLQGFVSLLLPVPQGVALGFAIAAFQAARARASFHRSASARVPEGHK